MSAINVSEGCVPTLDVLMVNQAPNMRLRLFKNNIVPTRGSTLASFTVADFSGYVQQTPTWGAISLDANGNAKVPGDPVVFTHNGGGTANTIYGWFLVETATNKVLYADTFAAPLSLAAAGNTATVNPTLYQGPILPPA